MESNIAGDITNISGQKHILSIGYEVECGILMKLTESVTGDSVLFNSDTARKDILEFKIPTSFSIDFANQFIDEINNLSGVNLKYSHFSKFEYYYYKVIMNKTY